MNHLRTLLRYGVAAGTGTLVHYLILVFGAVGLGAPAGLSSGLGALVGSMLNYIVSYWFVFESSRAHTEALPRFLLSTALVTALSAAGVEYGLSLGAHLIVAQLGCSTLAFVSCYLMNRYWLVPPIHEEEMEAGSATS